MSANRDQLLIIVNPESGNKQAVIDIAAHVLPLLNGILYQLKTTGHPGHAGDLARDFIESGDGLAILCAGGDGTTHEVVNALAFNSSQDSSPLPAISLILYPGGTANALFASIFSNKARNPNHAHLLPPETDEQVAYRLKSVLAYIHSRSATPPQYKPLSIAYTEIKDAKDVVVDKSVGIVVASTALHAAILHTAEGLRSTISGLERFQVAAMKNVTNWYSSNVKLLGPDGHTSEGVQYYDLDTDSIVGHPEAKSTSTLSFKGPFSYFLSTVNVDRLEPTFYITAPFTTHPPPANSRSMEIIIIRPARNPAYSGDGETERGKFAQEVISKVFPAAYDNGAHVGLRYEVGESGKGKEIVEYYRAAGWEWTPVSQL